MSSRRSWEGTAVLEHLAGIVTVPSFNLALSIMTYLFGVYICNRFKIPLVNPLLVSAVLIIAYLVVFHIPFETYSAGGGVVIDSFLPITVVCLAVSLYRQLPVLKSGMVPILVGTAVGALTAMGSVFALCKLFRLEDQVTASMLPKSVTTPIGLELSKTLGGVPSITMVAIIFTGIFGGILCAALTRVCRLKNKVAVGIAMGTSSHAIGTAKAIEMGEVQGAMSGLAIALAGTFTVLFGTIIPWIP